MKRAYLPLRSTDCSAYTKWILKDFSRLEDCGGFEYQIKELRNECQTVVSRETVVSGGVTSAARNRYVNRIEER